MGYMGDKRREKRLVKICKYAQKDDVALPATVHTALRFLLRNKRYVGQINVKADDTLSTAISEPPTTIPRFLLSQLQDQKIADRDRLPVQISEAVQFITATLAAKPTRGKSFPALFRSYNKTKHRTYFVFAYLNYRMDSRTYSIEELLLLRHAYSVTVVKQLKSNHEIANIIKDQGNVSPALSPPTKLANGDASSSTESEEVIFQGKANPQVVQWRFRGRTETESAKDEPIKAPTGLQAQQSEGFKRFYKAVVSPTHVRVTAGGRIVPNTRGSPSPTAKWDKEHSSAGAQETLGAPKDSKSEPSTNLNGQAPYHPLMQPAFPGHPGVFHHMGLPMPLYPIHPGIPLAYGMTSLPLVHPGSKQASSGPDQKGREAGPKTQDGAGDKKPRPAPIKIAPPDQFDQNRPFYYNGHVVYPSAYAPDQAMALPSPYYQFGPMSQPSPFGQGFSPAFASPAFASPTFVGSASSGGAPGPWPLSAPNPNMGPHVTTIKPSEVTRRQLKQLRQSLKYYEDQLQYNRHQIDEKIIEDQVQKIRQNVRQFEQLFKSQAYYESTQTPPSSENQGRRLQTPLGQSSMINRGGANHSGASSVAGSIRGHGPKSTPHNSNQRRPWRRYPPWLTKRLRRLGINYTTGILAPFGPEDPRLEAIIKDIEKDMSTSPDTAGIVFQPEGGSSDTNDLSEPQLYGVRPIGQLDTRSSGLFMNDQPAPVNFSQNRLCEPYLVGKLPQGMNIFDARSTDYVYERQLTDGEKQARENYWGKIAMPGSGLPKFDGQNFYPPSPVKAFEQNSSHLVRGGQPPVDYKMHSGPTDSDPFSSSRTAPSIRPQKGSQKFSKAIPIVAPKDGPKSTASRAVSQSNEMTDDLCKAMKAIKISSPVDKPSEDPAKEKKSTPGRRIAERSSKSGHELWQTMLKKGSTSSAVLPGAVSSTTATGYLPPYQGNAAASLGPSVSNANSSGARISSQKPTDNDSSQPATEKVGENCPPSEARSADYDPLKDAQERMIRDAQRRGVIGSD